MTVSGLGKILVQPGLQWTYGIMPAHVGYGADTGLTISDIQPLRDDIFVALSASSITGFSTHLDEQGLRGWYTNIQDAVKLPKRASLSALISGRLQPLNPDDHAPPLNEAAFLARLGNQSIDGIAKQLYPLDPDADVDCGTKSPKGLDYTMLLPSSSAYKRDMAWISGTAPHDATGRARSLSHVIELAAYRATIDDQSPEERADEFQAYAAAVWTLYAGAANQAEFVQAARTETESFTESWCRWHARFALAIVDPDRRASYENEVVEIARTTFVDDPNAPPSREGYLGYLALLEMGASGILGTRALEFAYEQVKMDEMNVCGDRASSFFIKTVAPTQRLPDDLVKALFARLQADGRGSHRTASQHRHGPPSSG